MDKYRIRFSKDGRAKFLSHLDLLRIFSRLARREDIDLVYSSGFNPHAEIVFSAPLPLGMTSDAEYVDLLLNGPADENELMEKLSRSLPEGITPLKIRHLEQGEPNVMKNVDFCAYDICVGFEDARSCNIFPEAVERCLSGNGPVFTMKKSKSGTKLTDIRPLIREFGQDLRASEDGSYQFRAVLAAGNENNLRPETAFRGIMDNINGIDPAEADDGGNDGGEERAENLLSCKILSARKIGYLDRDMKELW